MKFKSENQRKIFIRKVQDSRGKLEDIDKIDRLSKKGLNNAQIAIMLGTTRQAVFYALKKYRKNKI